MRPTRFLIRLDVAGLGGAVAASLPQRLQYIGELIIGIQRQPAWMQQAHRSSPNAQCGEMELI